MKAVLWAASAFLLLAATSVAPEPASDSIAADGGPIQITPITHGSVQLEYAGKVIHVDPWSRGDYSGAPQADLILVTDIHQDHLDPDMIGRLRKPGAPVVSPKAAAEKISEATVMANGEQKTVAGFAIETVPMYNLQPSGVHRRAQGHAGHRSPDSRLVRRRPVPGALR